MESVGASIKGATELESDFGDLKVDREVLERREDGWLSNNRGSRAKVLNVPNAATL